MAAKTKKASGPSVDESVTQALITLATADGPMRLSGKGDPPSLFPSATKASKEVLARLQADDHPLVSVVKVGKTATVRLTTAGFRHVLPHLPEEKVGGPAKALAAELPLSERVEFLNEIVRRTPPAAAELLPVLEEATAADKAESEARTAAAAKRRATEEASLKAIERWKQMIEERRKQRIETLKRELEAEGAKPTDIPDPLPNPPPQPRRPAVSLLTPETAEDRDFRRQVARRLVSAWLESLRLGKPEGRRFLEVAMGNIDGLEPIAEADQPVSFNGQYHRAETGVPTGTRVTVIRPGWKLIEDGGEYVVEQALVKP